MEENKNQECECATKKVDINVIRLSDGERVKCEIWTRVMGYHRPKSSFNRGKVAEFNERKNFEEAKAVAHLYDNSETDGDCA